MSLYKKISFGYNYSENREIVSLIFISYVMVIIFMIPLAALYINGNEILPVTYRFHAIILLFIVNLILIKQHFILPAKLLTLYLFPFLLVILGPLTGMVEDEIFFWHPYAPIAFSIIAHFILKPKKDVILKSITILIYFTYVLFANKFLIHFAQEDYLIISILNENSLFLNIIPALIFIFINVAVGFLNNLNDTYHENLHEIQDQLIQNEKLASLGILAAGIAHEINNPLNFISGSMQQIESLLNEAEKKTPLSLEAHDKFMNEMQQLIAYSNEGIERTTNIVEKLGSLNPEKIKNENPTKLNLIINEIIQRYHEQYKPHITIENRLKNGYLVDCRAQNIEKIFKIIIDNAIDAINEDKNIQKGIIIIDGKSILTNGKESFLLSIANNGPQIADHHIKRIFDPFFTTKNDPIRGLGLSEAYSIIYRVGGTIKGRNTNDFVEFILTIPKTSS